MRLYPDLPVRRAAALARDGLVLALLVLLALIGLAVHDAVDRVAVLGQGVHDAGSSIQGGFDTAADAVDDAPLVGGELAEGLRDAGEGSGGNLADLGREGEERTHRLADVLGVLTFGLPAAFLLGGFLPSRIGTARRLSAAARVLGEPDTPERRRLVAMRAAFALPYGDLLRHTPDPLGDLERERYDALVAAAFEDVGLRPRAR